MWAFSESEDDLFCNLMKKELHHVPANNCEKIFENISKRLDNVWILLPILVQISQNIQRSALFLLLLKITNS